MILTTKYSFSFIQKKRLLFYQSIQSYFQQYDRRHWLNADQIVYVITRKRTISLPSFFPVIKLFLILLHQVSIYLLTIFIHFSISIVLNYQLMMILSLLLYFYFILELNSEIIRSRLILLLVTRYQYVYTHLYRFSRYTK